MKKKYTYDISSEHIIIVRFAPYPQASDIKDAINELAKIDQAGYRLWDLTNGFNLPAEEITELSKYARSKWPITVKVAFVAPDPLAFGNVRMFSSLKQQDSEEYMVFKTEAEALNFLNNQLND